MGVREELVTRAPMQDHLMSLPGETIRPLWLVVILWPINKRGGEKAEDNVTKARAEAGPRPSVLGETKKDL